MASISTVFKDRGTGPYSKALKITVVAVDDQPLTYKGKDGTAKASLSSAGSDGERIVKIICYDPTKFSRFTVGTTIVLRDIIRKSEQSVQAVVITKASKVFISSPLKFPDNHKEQGKQLLNPPPSDKVPIKTALTSPLKTRVSILGKLVQEEESKTVTVKGEEVPIKSVIIEDASGQAKVTLWRLAADTSARPGDYVSITDVVVNHYQNTTTLNTTTKSKVQKCDAPVEQCTIIIEAADIEGDDIELYLQSEDTLKVPTIMLQNALTSAELDENVELALSKGPITMNIKKMGSDIISMNMET